MEWIPFIIFMAVLYKFWKWILVLMLFWIPYTMVKGLLAAHDRLPPPNEYWQMPWNVVHGEVTGDEIFWTIFVAFVVWFIYWATSYNRRATRRRERRERRRQGLVRG